MASHPVVKWCSRRDSNPQSETRPAPQAGVSANSTTRARVVGQRREGYQRTGGLASVNLREKQNRKKMCFQSRFSVHATGRSALGGVVCAGGERGRTMRCARGGAREVRGEGHAMPHERCAAGRGTARVRRCAGVNGEGNGGRARCSHRAARVMRVGNGGAIITSRRVCGPAAHRAADRAAACKTLSVCYLQSRAPRRWRGGAMGTSRPTATGPHHGHGAGCTGGVMRVGNGGASHAGVMAVGRDVPIAPPG